MWTLETAKNRETENIEFLIEELMSHYNPVFLEEMWRRANSFCQYTNDRRSDKTSFDFSCSNCPIFKAENKECYETDWHKKIEKAILKDCKKPIPLLLAYKMWIEEFDNE